MVQFRIDFYNDDVMLLVLVLREKNNRSNLFCFTILKF